MGGGNRGYHCRAAFYLEAFYSGSGCGTIRGKALIDLAWPGAGARCAMESRI